MKTRWWLLAVAVSVSMLGMAYAQLSTPPFAEQETGVQRIQYIESGKTLYNVRWTCKRVARGGRTFLEYQLTGDNNLQGAARIDWTEQALMEWTAEGVRTINWAKKSTGAERMSWQLDYDWAGRVARYTYVDNATGKKEAKTIKIATGAIAGDALNFVLRSFPFEKGKGTQIKGQIIMTDGSTLEGVIIHLGEEKLKTAFGIIDTYKLQLKPAGALGMVAPKMFMWYTKSAPHIWLRFDGRDDGLTNPRTMNTLVDFQPRNLIAR